VSVVSNTVAFLEEERDEDVPAQRPSTVRMPIPELPPVTTATLPARFACWAICNPVARDPNSSSGRFPSSRQLVKQLIARGFFLIYMDGKLNEISCRTCWVSQRQTHRSAKFGAIHSAGLSSLYPLQHARLHPPHETGTGRARTTWRSSPVGRPGTTQSCPRTRRTLTTWRAGERASVAERVRSPPWSGSAAVRFRNRDGGMPSSPTW